MKHLFLIALCLLSVRSPGRAQDAQLVDSLLAIYEHPASADTLKVQVLGQLHNAYLYNDLEQAKTYLARALALSRRIGYERGVALSRLQQGVMFDLSGQLDSAFIQYSQAREYFQRVNDLRMLGKASTNLANIAYQQGDYARATEILRGLIDQFREKPPYGDLLGLAYELLGRVYDAQGYYQLALEHTLRALELYEQHDNEIRMADATNVLGGIELSLMNYQNSVDYNLQATAIYEKHNDHYFLAQTLNDLGNSYYYLRDYAAAKPYLLQSITLAKSMEAADVEGTALNNLGKIYLEEGDWQQAAEAARTSLAIHRSSASNNKVVESLHTLGRAYLKAGQPAQALPHLRQAVALADSIQSIESLKQSYFYRAEAFESLGNHQAALADYREFHRLSDTILNQAKITRIEELRILHDIEQKEKEIELFTKNAELDAAKKAQLRIALLAAIALGGLLIWTQWQRRRKEQLLHRKEQEIQRERNRVAELKNRQLAQELDFKKQELTSKVLQLCRKNEFLQSLNQEVTTYQTDAAGDERHRLEKLSRKIRRDFDVDDDWQQFLQAFETVHPDFSKALLHQYPDLAPNELRMACLMRMNLETKDIANLLNITPDGVKKARYRMRKKMGQDSTVNLTEYFMHFGHEVADR